MKIGIILIVFVTFETLRSQDTSSAWLNQIDTLKFELFHKKKHIPQEFFSVIGIENKSEIANRHGHFKAGCVGWGKSVRLNWLAKDSQNHWILSVDYGGIGHYTYHYFIDYDTGKMNVNAFYFYPREDYWELNFGEVISKLKRRKFTRIE